MCNVDKYLSERYLKAIWIIASSSIFILSLIVLMSPHWDYQWMKSAILWFSLSAFGPAFFALMLHTLSKLQNLGAEISKESPRIAVDPIKITLASIAFLAFALATTLSVNIFPFEMWANRLAFFIAGTFFLFYGAISYLYMLTLLFAIRLRQVRVGGSLFAWPRESIEAMYDLYIRILLIGGFTYMAGVGVVRLTPWATSWQSLDQPWIYLWVLPPGFVLILYFAVFSVALHNLLVQCRRRAEREISEKLQKKYELWKNEPQPSSENSISALLTWRDSVRQEKVWPMDFKATTATVATLLIPSIEAITKFFYLE